jgi:signal transduction histidine kinase
MTGALVLPPTIRGMMDALGDQHTFYMDPELYTNETQALQGEYEGIGAYVDLDGKYLAIVSPKGAFLFTNPAFRSLMPAATPGGLLKDVIPAEHPLFRLAHETLAMRQAHGPIAATFPVRGETAERLISAHPVNDAATGLVGIMLTIRNLEYFAQVESTVRYSRKLAALGRLSAGVAHEVKNPLNAMMIHLELLRQKFSPRTRRVAAGVAVRGGVASAEPPPFDPAEALQHVNVIAGEIRRLDEVVQGFLKFSRPEDLKLQPMALSALFAEVIPIVKPEAERNGVLLSFECDGSIEVNADSAMLRQAFLNLALNACQAMPNGGALQIACTATRGNHVVITFADTGVGIKPEHLKRIFDLYFTTKDGGSGIGLSMVYRTVQMHDGEIEVESTPGKGTTFRVTLPKA